MMPVTASTPAPRGPVPSSPSPMAASVRIAPILQIAMAKPRSVPAADFWGRRRQERSTKPIAGRNGSAAPPFGQNSAPLRNIFFTGARSLKGPLYSAAPESSGPGYQGIPPPFPMSPGGAVFNLPNPGMLPGPEEG
jgi:hypothetical protein